MQSIEAAVRAREAGLRQAGTLAHAHGRGVACLHIDLLLLALRVCLFTIRTDCPHGLQ